MRYSLKIKHQHHFETLMAVAKSKELSICEDYLEDGYEEWPVFLLRLDGLDGFHVAGAHNLFPEEYTQVSFDKMLQIICEETLDVIKLTDEYTAFLDREKFVVRVGCQEIPFSKVEELYNLIIKN